MKRSSVLISLLSACVVAGCISSGNESIADATGATVAGQLIKDGRALHAYMGVSTVTIDPSSASRFGLAVEHGALVQFVEPGSPADAAGIERGDILVVVDGREIGGSEDVFAAIRANRVGDTVEVEVVRADARRVLKVTLGSDGNRG